MLLEYIAIGVMIAVATLIAFIAIGLGELFGPRKNTEAKNVPYESGTSLAFDCAAKEIVSVKKIRM